MPTAAEERIIVEDHIRPQVDVDDWVSAMPGEPTYSTNQVIGAFSAGVKTKVQRVLSVFEEQLKEHIEQSKQRAASLTHTVIEKLQSSGFHPVSAHLRVVEPDEFDVLVTVPKQEFFADAFMQFYEFTGEIENKETDENFVISFHFYGQSDNFNDAKMFSDGYVYLHKSLVK